MQTSETKKIERFGRLVAAIMLACCLCLCVVPARAQTQCQIYNCVTENGAVYLYSQNPGEITDIVCQIGTERCTDIEVMSVQEANVPVETYILFDNSLSVQEQYRDMIKNIGLQIVSSKTAQEKITIATFDQQLHTLIEQSSDAGQLRQAVEQIEYENQNTSVMDVLYQLYEQFEQREIKGICRVIVITDGVGSSGVGYTKEEVAQKIQKYHYPVYTLGCTYKSNEDELEDLFRISRATNASYFLMDNVQETSQVINELNTIYDAIQTRIVIPENLADGMVKAMKLTYSSAEGKKTLTTELTMPFANLDDTEGMSESEMHAEGQGGFSFLTGLVGKLGLKDGAYNSMQLMQNIAILAIPILLLVLIVTLMITRRGKRKDRKEIQSPSQTKKDLSDETERIYDLTERTEIIQGNGRQWDTARIRLTDINNPRKYVETSFRDSITIGREQSKSQIVFEYDRSVSGQHCELRFRSGNIYICDVGSGNGTYVDGQRVMSEMKIEDGSVIRLGRLQLKFEIF